MQLTMAFTLARTRVVITDDRQQVTTKVDRGHHGEYDVTINTIASGKALLCNEGMLWKA